MATADEQIRVTGRLKRELDRRRREGESYNDVLERNLAERDGGGFDDGLGRWTRDQVDRIREQRQQHSKEKRKQRLRRLAGEDT